jgi:heme/copper-type cytochrome/quinol oxidase subunit 2
MFYTLPTDRQVSLQIDQGVEVIHLKLFYDYLILFLVFILTFVVWMISRALFKYTTYKKPIKITTGSLLEFIWTIIPSVVLCFIAVPSFFVLYYLDGVFDPKFNVRVIGHQWYWTYEFNLISDQKELFPLEGISNYLETNYFVTPNIVSLNNFDPDTAFWSPILIPIEERNKLINSINQEHASREVSTITMDSFMIGQDELPFGSFRLLECQPLVLMQNYQTRVLITSSDVLHSWAVPSFGVKVDAVPGRLNQTVITPLANRIFAYGQCSELCGAFHGFMPIKIYIKSIFGMGK